MKGKHERLPTHVLILASRSGFTNEARKVAQLNGIEAISFDEVDRTNFDDLFKGKSSLFTKCMTISPDKVVVGVLPTTTLPAESVAAHQLSVFNADGSLIGLMGHLVIETMNSPDMLQQLLKQGDEQHRWFIFQWETPRDKKGMPIFLQKLEPLVFRDIQFIEIDGPCEFKINEFALRRGKLGAVEVAWGKTKFFEKAALLVSPPHRSE